MYIDSHAHLFDEDFRGEIDDVVRRAQAAGVETIIVPGTTLETSREAIRLAEKYEFVYACVGYHPHEASKVTDHSLTEIEELSKHGRVVAIGEIGLDYHYAFSPRVQQIEVFRKQIEIAVRRDLPIVVHTRESIPEAIGTVEDVVKVHPNWRVSKSLNNKAGEASRGVFHCFTGDVEQAERLFGVSFSVSYPGIVTFKNSPVIDTLKHIGYHRILIETDSPYLAPVPLRGKRNEPAFIVHVARRIAEIFETSETEIARVTKENTARLFGLPALSGETTQKAQATL